jgi:hypothetical protein
MSEESEELLSEYSKSHRRTDWKRYFLELLVVFLGVTMGFILNNWREDSSNADLKFKYLNSFLLDVDSNLVEVNDLIETDSLWLNRCRNYVLMMQADTFPKDSIIPLFSTLIQTSKSDFQSGTYTDILNSGNLHLIEDFELRTEITFYHESLTGVHFVEDYAYTFFSDFNMPYALEKFDFMNIEENYDEVLDDFYLRNIVVGYYSMIRQRSDMYRTFRRKSQHFQGVLHAEIKKFESS